MFHQHHSNWSAFSGNAVLLHQRKQELFLLEVVALIGEVAEEINAFFQRGGAGPYPSYRTFVDPLYSNARKTDVSSERLIALLQAPVGDLNAAREPDLGKALGVANELVDDFGSKRHAGNKRVQVKSKELGRALLAFPVEIIELVFHDLQEISGRSSRAIGRVVITARNIVGNNDDFPSLGVHRVGVVRIERIGPPDKAR